ncbi:MAG: class I SAM-dependent methyltransferase [Rhabdochlamydiaceae bacterium]|jgi:ubiquinone/menaquinone biosynthesis C-methylase UbiE
MKVDDIDLDASYYQDHSQPQYERAQEFLKSLNLAESASVLDVGCGHGNIIAEISQKAPKGKSIGLDASSDMIRLAREKFLNSKFPNLEFQHAKAEEMSFMNDCFDVITCFSCLLWVREPKKALDLMCKSLKPGGILLILTYLKESAYITFLEKTLEEFSSYKKLSAVHTMLSIEEYKDILRSQKFELDEFRPEWRLSKYKNTEELKTYIRGWLTCYVPLPEELQESFLNKAVEKSLTVSISSRKDEIVLPYQVLAIKARKPID